MDKETLLGLIKLRLNALMSIEGSILQGNVEHQEIKETRMEMQAMIVKMGWDMMELSRLKLKPTEFALMAPYTSNLKHEKINSDDSHKIILYYLIHGCFKDTVESLAVSADLKITAAQLEEMEKRKGIVHCALEGNALDAIRFTEQMSPDLLENNQDLLFDLLSLHFVELICLKKCTEALSFAQERLTPFGKVKKYVEKLEDFMALLAYEEPEKSPMFHLLSADYRQHVADTLNRAILAGTNMPGHSELERLIQQATVVRQCLSEEVGKLTSLSLETEVKGSIPTPCKAGGPFLPLVEPEAASLPLVGVGLSTSQPPSYTVEDGIGTHNPWKTVLGVTYLLTVSFR
ncbi:glucose-induced degradation protein 8 homolog isoform X1 [Tanacetum coccineum]